MNHEISDISKKGNWVFGAGMGQRCNGCIVRTHTHARGCVGIEVHIDSQTHEESRVAGA